MIKYLLLALLSLCLFIMSTTALAEHDDYFAAINDVIKIPNHAAAIQPSNRTEIKDFFFKLKKSHLPHLKTISMDEDGNIHDEWSRIEIYQADFSNEHVKEYALISTSGSMNTNTVIILEEKNGRLSIKNLDSVIISNLIPGGDLSRFYYYVGKPFAYTMNGKTYIRYMDYPYKEYDASHLRVCTYLWKGTKMKLAGPNWRYDVKAKKRVPANDCITHTRDKLF